MILAMLACAPSAATLPTVWSYDERQEAPAPFSLDDLSAGVGEVVDALVAADPREVFSAFDEGWARGDEACPEVYLHNAQPVVSGDCTAASGTTYLGFALINELEGIDLDYDGARNYHERLQWTTGLLRIVGDDGWTMEVLGDDLHRVYLTDDGARVIDVYLWGDFYAEGNAWGDGWLGRNMGVQMYFEGEIRSERTTSTWDARIARLDGTVEAAVVALTGDDGCAVEGAGTVQVEDGEGRWYEVLFEGAADCDGCGDASLDGEALGELCVDQSPLFGWEESPW